MAYMNKFFNNQFMLSTKLCISSFLVEMTI